LCRPVTSDRINWRKFEGLTAEFFDRSGFEVKIGRGRNDDGIDVRVWPREAEKEGARTILIQCKRENRQVGKVIVKSLWADLKEENAESGLIVTTTGLSPGAKKTCIARGYPIEDVNRRTLQAWLEAMKSPYAGVFMGE
jgi:restriction system protein